VLKTWNLPVKFSLKAIFFCFFTLFFMYTAQELYAAGKKDQDLARADALIQEKHYVIVSDRF